MKKDFSRRRILTLGALGIAGGAAMTQAHGNPAMRFLAQRIAELAKPSIAPRHKPKPTGWDDNDITAAWLGHSTVLINFQGMNIITDPVLFSRIGAQSVIGTVGPIRRESCALRARELPKIDLVLISHAHFDHLDFPSLRALPGKPAVVTARNTRDLFADTPFENATELGWGQRKILESSKGSKGSKGEAEVIAFEVNHWGARWRMDTQRGYNGYIVKRGGKKIMFGGDTAMCSGFKETHGKGPFEFACMPIGAYTPYIHSHCNPEQALQMANEAGAKFVLPIHYYTFRFGREQRNEPIERLQDALKHEEDRLGWREAGETFKLKA